MYEQPFGCINKCSVILRLFEELFEVGAFGDNSYELCICSCSVASVYRWTSSAVLTGGRSHATADAAASASYRLIVHVYGRGMGRGL